MKKFMSAVIEQGATRWVRPEDYIQSGKKSKNRFSVPGEAPRHYDPSKRKPRRRLRDPRKHLTPKPRKSFGKKGLKVPNIATFGRAMPRAILRRHPLFTALELLQLVIPAEPGTSWPANYVPSGWKIRWLCNWNNIDGWADPTGTCGSGHCATGQASPAYAMGTQLPANTLEYVICDRYTSLGAPRWRPKVWFVRNCCPSSCGGQTFPAETVRYPNVKEAVALDLAPAQNPNVMRAMPSVRPRPSDLTVVQPDFGIAPKSDAETLADMLGSPVRTPPSRFGWSFGPEGKTPTKPIGIRPPKAGEREPPKGLSKSQRVGIALFGALDDISELSELVDAFYGALPDEIQDKTDCTAARGLLDTAGQYGIDNADCKIQAIVRYAAQIDTEVAVRNIVANFLQDRVIGDINKHLPPGTARAINAFEYDKDGNPTETGGLQKVNEILEWIFSESGLT